MGNLTFTEEAWDDYLYWQRQDKKTLNRINTILKDINRNPFDGIGMPEPLKGNMSGYWSRRIDSKNRIVYRVCNGSIELMQYCRHYNDK